MLWAVFFVNPNRHQTLVRLCVNVELIASRFVEGVAGHAETGREGKMPTGTHKQAEEYVKQAFLQILRSNDRFVGKWSAAFSLNY